jgi:hypothetical protein
MRTDRLIDILSTNVEPAKSGRLGKTLGVAFVVGGVAAFCAMVMTIGLRIDGADGIYLRTLAPKLLFTLSLIGMGAAFLVRAMRPGQDEWKPLLPVVLPFLVAGLAAVAAVAVERPADWGGMIFGTQWASCLICIPLLSIAPFASLVWALRTGAPTNLIRTGAIAGLVAGALGAAIFAFHHPGGSIPFIVLWYGGPIVLCALAGAIFGPRLLRW